MVRKGSVSRAPRFVQGWVCVDEREYRRKGIEHPVTAMSWRDGKPTCGTCGAVMVEKSEAVQARFAPRLIQRSYSDERRKSR